MVACSCVSKVASDHAAPGAAGAAAGVAGATAGAGAAVADFGAAGDAAGAPPQADNHDARPSADKPMSEWRMRQRTLARAITRLAGSTDYRGFRPADARG